MMITSGHIFNSTSNDVIAIDDGGRVVLICGQAEEILGLERDRVVRTPIIEVLPNQIERCAFRLSSNCL
jgi:signal transduction histidine kinase